VKSKEHKLRKVESKLREAESRNSRREEAASQQQSLENIRKKLDFNDENTSNNNSNSSEDVTNDNVFSADNNIDSNNYNTINQVSARSVSHAQNAPIGSSAEVTVSSKSKSKVRESSNGEKNNTSRSAKQIKNEILMTNQSDDGLDTSIRRMKNFSEIELDQVRSRLQQRLNELEPLPELLRTTEAKLQESYLKLKQCETQNTEYKNLVTKLKFQLDLAEKEIALSKRSKDSKKLKDGSNSSRLSESIASTLKQVEKSTKQKTIIEQMNKLEPIEEKLRKYEDEVRELVRLLGIKEDLIRDLTAKLTNESSKASSLARQLDLALSDSTVKEQQLRERSMTKVFLLFLYCYF
jgi:hypothetical protein